MEARRKKQNTLGLAAIHEGLRKDAAETETALTLPESARETVAMLMLRRFATSFALEGGTSRCLGLEHFLWEMRKEDTSPR